MFQTLASGQGAAGGRRALPSESVPVNGQLGTDIQDCLVGWGQWTLSALDDGQTASVQRWGASHEPRTGGRGLATGGLGSQNSRGERQRLRGAGSCSRPSAPCPPARSRGEAGAHRAMAPRQTPREQERPVLPAAGVGGHWRPTAPCAEAAPSAGASCVWQLLGPTLRAQGGPPTAAGLVLSGRGGVPGCREWASQRPPASRHQERSVWAVGWLRGGRAN